MCLLADCHIHSELCGHAQGTPAEMISAVVDAGLYGAIMTEHLPLKAELDPDGVYSMRGEIDVLYVAELRDIRFDWDGLNLVIGAEADWIDNDIAWTQESVLLAREKGIEVVLGSVHFLDGWAFDDPSLIDRWEDKDVDRVWEHYFTQWCQAAQSGLFDVMAHPDLVKKFGHVATNSADFYDEASRAASLAGVLCEVSTAGLRKPVGQLYPDSLMIELLIQRGVGLTMGSDAHRADEVGFRFDECARELYRLGARQVAYPQREGRVTWLEL